MGDSVRLEDDKTHFNEDVKTHFDDAPKTHLNDDALLVYVYDSGEHLPWSCVESSELCDVSDGLPIDPPPSAVGDEYCEAQIAKRRPMMHRPSRE